MAENAFGITQVNTIKINTIKMKTKFKKCQAYRLKSSLAEPRCKWFKQCWSCVSASAATSIFGTIDLK